MIHSWQDRKKKVQPLLHLNEVLRSRARSIGPEAQSNGNLVKLAILAQRANIAVARKSLNIIGPSRSESRRVARQHRSKPVKSQTSPWWQPLELRWYRISVAWLRRSDRARPAQPVSCMSRRVYLLRYSVESDRRSNSTVLRSVVGPCW